MFLSPAGNIGRNAKSKGLIQRGLFQIFGLARLMLLLIIFCWMSVLLVLWQMTASLIRFYSYFSVNLHDAFMISFEESREQKVQLSFRWQDWGLNSNRNLLVKWIGVSMHTSGMKTDFTDFSMMLAYIMQIWMIWKSVTRENLNHLQVYSWSYQANWSWSLPRAHIVPNDQSYSEAFECQQIKLETCWGLWSRV